MGAVFESPFFLKDSSACIITGSGCCCFVMSLVVRFQTVSGVVFVFRFTV